MTPAGSALDDIGDSRVVVDATSGAILRVDEQYRELTGVTETDLLGRHVSTIVGGSETQFGDVRRLAATVGDVGPLRLEASLRVVDGPPLSATLQMSATRYQGDPALSLSVRPTGIAPAPATDDGEALLRRLADNVRDVLWMFTGDWTELVYANSAYERVWGRSIESLYENPRSFLDGVHPADRQRVEDAMVTLSGGESVSMEYRILTPDGEESVVAVNAEPITDDDGSVVYVGGFCREVTERRRQRRELERQRRLFETIPVGVFRIGVEEGRFVEVNPAMAALFGAESASDLAGRSVREFLVETSLEDEVLASLREQGATTFETQFTRLDGVDFWGRVSTVLHTDDEDQPVVDGVVEDITDRKERHEQLAVVDRILRHNVRNDVSVVLGYANYILDHVDGELAEAAEKIRSRAGKLSRTAEKERTIVRNLSDSTDLDEVDLVGVLESVADRFRESNPALTVETDLPTSALVTAKQNIDAAFTELVENAIRHHHEESPTVRLTVERVGDRVAVHVADDGPGIPDIEREILTRDVEVEPLAHGSGTGLWLVRWLVRLSEGTIEVDSSDAGTTVTVTFPACERSLGD